MAESVDSILSKASSLQGTPYRYGGISPSGFDCSGFVSYLYKETVPQLPRLSREMFYIGEPVQKGEWKLGDLLFYATGKNPKRINHVAIWYDENRLIHSVSNGPETGVIVTLASSRYWKQHYIGAKRVLPQNPSSNNLPLKKSAPKEKPAPVETSPWDNFDGILQGDYESWKATEDELFENYKRKNG